MPERPTQVVVFYEPEIEFEVRFDFADGGAFLEDVLPLEDPQ